MATAPVPAESRLSFANVAASAGKDNVAFASFAKVVASPAVATPRKENVALSNPASKDLGDVIFTPINATSKAVCTNLTTLENKEEDPQAKEVVATTNASAAEVTKLADAVEALGLRDAPPSLVVNGSGITSHVPKGGLAEAFPEDLFQRADSGSDLGTKPQSLDGKSITSGTTFALDEKESLRPDDSASVMAAEDDDTFSGRGSIVAGSRIGSEAAARAYRTQLYEGRNMPPMLERQIPGVMTPQSGSSEHQVIEDVKSKQLGSASGPSDQEAFSLFYRQTPDEKLLEALESPKDRIFLLRLEQQVIEFVKDTTEPFIDLPPCNSFCRMLTHKLADYYHMTHQVDAGLGGVRVFRTPFCRLPAPLTSISNPPTSGNTPPPAPPPAMKIMRRGGEGTGPSPSKATSETGSDGKDKGLSAKEKLSIEERKVKYDQVRERIFGKDHKSGEATPDTEDGNEMSRSSSLSTREKSGQSKRKLGKQRREEDNFDVRSQYTPIFPQQQQAWVTNPQYGAMGHQPYNMIQNGFQTAMPQQYAQSQQFSPPIHMMNNSSASGFSGAQQVYQTGPHFGMPLAAPGQFVQGQNGQPRYQHNMPVQQSSYGSPPAQSPAQMSQQWQQQGQYQAPGLYQARAPTGRAQAMTVPYQFGQLPNSANPADPKSQHPIPGSFNRHAFNPKTQSFVPGNAGLPISQPMAHNASPHQPHQASSHHGSPHLAYNVMQQQQQYGSMSYGMARQGSNNSMQSYHVSPHMAHRQMMGMAQGMPQGMPQGLPQVMPQVMPPSYAPQGLPHNYAQNMSSHGMQQGGSHLPNFGNPSTLPPKPTGI